MRSPSWPGMRVETGTQNLQYSLRERTCAIYVFQNETGTNINECMPGLEIQLYRAGGLNLRVFMASQLSPLISEYAPTA